MLQGHPCGEVFAAPAILSPGPKVNEQGELTITIWTPQKHFILLGGWNRGIKWQGEDVADSIPQERKCASFVRVESYWNLQGLQRSSSIFKTTKYIVLGHTNTYNCTYTTFCFKNKLWNSNTEKGCRSKTTGSDINYTWDQGLITVTPGPSPAFHTLEPSQAPSFMHCLYLLSCFSGRTEQWDRGRMAHKA